MKLKYYLRGLGIGIAITTLILMISYNINGRMSDSEIIRRAKELGMIMATDESDDLFEKMQQRRVLMKLITTLKKQLPMKLLRKKQRLLLLNQLQANI